MKILIIILLSFTFQNINAQQTKKIADSITTKYGYVYPTNLSGYYFARTKKGKTAVIDSVGNVIIKPNFDYIERFESGLAEAVNTKNKITKRGLIDFNGNIIVPFLYDYIFRYSPENCIVTIGNKSGVINNKNEILIPIKYEYVTNGNDKTIIVKENNRLGFIGEDGIAITKIMYKNVERFYESVASVMLEDNSSSIINTKGKQLFTPIKNISFVNKKYDLLKGYNLKTTKIGVFNSKGEKVVPVIYDDIDIYDSSTIRIALKNKYGLVDKNNITKIPMEYDQIYQGAKQQFICGKGNKEAVFNSDYKTIIPLLYRNIQFLEDKFYIVTTTDSLNGVFDKNGQILVPVEYKFYNYCKGKIFAVKNNSFYIIDFENENNLKILDIEGFKNRNGNWYYANECTQISMKNKKYGVIDIDNTIIIPFEYDEIRNLNYSKRFIVKRNGKYGIVNYLNEIVHEIIYDNITQEKESLRFMKDGKRVYPKDDN